MSRTLSALLLVSTALILPLVFPAGRAQLGGDPKGRVTVTGNQ